MLTAAVPHALVVIGKIPSCRAKERSGGWGVTGEILGSGCGGLRVGAGISRYVGGRQGGVGAILHSGLSLFHRLWTAGWKGHYEPAKSCFLLSRGRQNGFLCWESWVCVGETVSKLHAKAGDCPWINIRVGRMENGAAAFPEGNISIFAISERHFPSNAGPETTASVKSGSLERGREHLTVQWDQTSQHHAPGEAALLCRLGKGFIPTHPTDPWQRHKNTPKSHSWFPSTQNDHSDMQDMSWWCSTDVGVEGGGKSRCHNTGTSVMRPL